MTDQNQLLREALEDIEQAHDLSLDLDHYASRQVLVSLADKIKVALAQPAEGGEVFDWPDRAVLSVMNQIGYGPYGEEDVKVTRYLLKIADEVRAEFTPPASQEQAAKARAWDSVRKSCVLRHAQVTLGDVIDTMDALLAQEMKASHSQAQQPSPQAWANETGLRQIECPSCGDLAVAYDPQQPSGGVVAWGLYDEDIIRTQAARIAELEAEVERLRGDSVPLGAIRALAVEAIRDVTGCPDIANGDKCITDTIEHIAQHATYRAIEAAKDTP